MDNTRTAIDFFEVEFGSITPAQRDTVEKILRLFMNDYRRVIDPHAPEGMACVESGPRCGSCAFNPSIDQSKDFLPTAFGVLKSLRDGLPFLCHRNQPGWKDSQINMANRIVCEGFKAGIENDVDRIRNLAVVALSLIYTVTGRPAPK
ncbi:MAG: hypothetical protein V4465_02915 [Patescibacteria group bacterium]